MGKIYQCNRCGQEMFFLSAQYIEPQCLLTGGCSGRLQYSRESKHNTEQEYEKAKNISLYKKSNSLIYTGNGTFCTYRLDEDRPNCKINFRGHTLSNPTEIYTVELDGNGVRGFDIPPGAEFDTPTSKRLVTNCEQSVDFVLFPPSFPENKKQITKQKSEMLSFGHGRGFSHPIRVMVGRQDCNNEHSGSGLIHIMFAHQKTNLLDVENLLKAIVGKDKIGAIYRTKELDPENYRRIIVLNRASSTNPYQLVLQQRETYYRLITVYKPEGKKSNYSKYEKKTDYDLVYSWNRSLYK